MTPLGNRSLVFLKLCFSTTSDAWHNLPTVIYYKLLVSGDKVLQKGPEDGVEVKTISDGKGGTVAVVTGTGKYALSSRI